MPRKTIGLAQTLVSSILLLAGTATQAANHHAEVVIDWNETLQATVGPTGGPLQPRWYAMMHIAMFDAANSIVGNYTKFRTSVPASKGASTEAAAAQAAHDVLVALLPASKDVYDAQLAAHLQRVAPGRRAQGVAVGKAVAARVLRWRKFDGVDPNGTTYKPPLLPGIWQETGGPAGLTHVPTMLPFTLRSPTQFLSPRFPELDTTAYAEDYEEVRDIGSATSATRTAEQTQTALLFAAMGITSTNIVTMWNDVAGQLAVQQDLSLLQAARLYALVNAVMIDGLITSQSGKFIYALWRPITAINTTFDDLNPATTTEPGWNSLLPTPPYPSYPGNMACIGAAAATALALIARTDAVPFSVTWTGANGNPDVTRNYAGFWELAQQEADSRIWGGIHFRFDNEASQVSCADVAEHAYGRVMRPIRR